MDGKFDDNLTLIQGGKALVASGPLRNWADDEVSAAVHVSITQGDVAAGGRTGDDVRHGADRFVLVALVEGEGTLVPGPASARGWALVRGRDGIEPYEWTVDVKLTESQTADPPVAAVVG